MTSKGITTFINFYPKAVLNLQLFMGDVETKQKFPFLSSYKPHFCGVMMGIYHTPDRALRFSFLHVKPPTHSCLTVMNDTVEWPSFISMLPIKKLSRNTAFCFQHSRNSSYHMSWSKGWIWSTPLATSSCFCLPRVPKPCF